MWSKYLSVEEPTDPNGTISEQLNYQHIELQYDGPVDHAQLVIPIDWYRQIWYGSFLSRSKVLLKIFSTR